MKLYWGSSPKIEYEYVCLGCRSYDRLGPEGGELSCRCFRPTHTVMVQKVLDGERIGEPEHLCDVLDGSAKL